MKLFREYRDLLENYFPCTNLKYQKKKKISILTHSKLVPRFYFQNRNSNKLWRNLSSWEKLRIRIPSLYMSLSKDAFNSWIGQWKQWPVSTQSPRMDSWVQHLSATWPFIQASVSPFVRWYYDLLSLLCRILKIKWHIVCECAVQTKKLLAQEY